VIQDPLVLSTTSRRTGTGDPPLAAGHGARDFRGCLTLQACHSTTQLTWCRYPAITVPTHSSTTSRSMIGS
jgi:hypothetical protein